MKIIVMDITETGIFVTADASVGWARQGAAFALDGVPELLSVDLRLTREGERVRVCGSLSAQLDRACDRCLAPITLHVSGDVDLLYLPQSTTDPVELQLSEDDLDVGWFDGRALDMGDVLSEQLTLWMPDRSLCDDPKVQRAVPGRCTPIAHDPGPELARHSPFSGLKLPS